MDLSLWLDTINWAGWSALFFFLVSRDCCVSFPHEATGSSIVSDCGISWSYSLTYFGNLSTYIEWSHGTRSKYYLFLVFLRKLSLSPQTVQTLITESHVNFERIHVVHSLINIWKKRLSFIILHYYNNYIIQNRFIISPLPKSLPIFKDPLGYLLWRLHATVSPGM